MNSLSSSCSNPTALLPPWVPRTHPVVYLCSGEHPLCSALLVHYYVVSLEKSRAARPDGHLSPHESSRNNLVTKRVCVGILEYDALVDSARRILAQLAAYHPRCQPGSSRTAAPTASRQCDTLELRWRQVAASTTPSRRVAMSLRASRVTSLCFENDNTAAAFFQHLQGVADAGGCTIVNDFDLMRDAVATASCVAFRSAISAHHNSESSTAQHIASSAPLLPTLPLRSKVLFVEHNAYITQQVCEVRRWTRPRDIIANSPRTFALWLRMQILRDASGDAHLAVASRAPPANPSDVDPSLSPYTKSAHLARSIASQRSQIMLQCGVASITPSSELFHPAARYLHRRRAQPKLHHFAPDDPSAQAVVGIAAALEAAMFDGAASTAVAARGPRGLRDLGGALAEIGDVVETFRLWLRLVVQCGRGATNEMLEQAMLDVLLPQRRGARPLLHQALTLPTRVFLLELERIRRRRAQVARTAITTAGTAAKDDFLQSNIVRSIETWMKARYEKALGHVGNLVGARMTVEPDWKTESHPEFGEAMRRRHFLWLEDDVVMLNGCQHPLTPIPVLRSRMEWRRVAQLDPVLFRFKTLMVQMAVAVAKLSKRLVCSPGELSLLHSREAALSTVLRSLPLLPGDVVLVVDPPNDAAYFASLHFLERYSGVNVQVLHLNVYASDDALKAHFTDAVSSLEPVLCIVPMLSTTGRVIPVDYFVSVCSQQGALSLVDGTDAVGNTTVNVVVTDCDVFVARLDNYMYAPVGATALFVKSKLHRVLTTLTVSYFYRATRHVENVTADLSQEAKEPEEFGGAFSSPWTSDDPEVQTALLEPGATSPPADGAKTATSSSDSAQDDDAAAAAMADRKVALPGSSYADEWWYTGLSDMSGLLAITQALQFRKFICFGGKEYCTRLACEAEAYLSQVWRVAPLLPRDKTSSAPNSIVCVQLPRSKGKTSSDATHVQQLLAQMRVYAAVLVLPSRKEVGVNEEGAPQAMHHALRPAAVLMSEANTHTVLAVRLTVQVYNDMMDVKRLAAAVIRLVTIENWAAD